MTGMQGMLQSPQQVGEEWIRALVEKDIRRFTRFCHPDVHSSLLTPYKYSSLDTALDLFQKVEQWFHEADTMDIEQERVEMVGERLAIFYRLRIEEHRQPFTIEQQLYCTLRDGRVQQLHLLCSGFQPVQPALEAAGTQALTGKALFQADDLLEVNSAGVQGSTCAILTPAIKRKLREMSSGQVLAVRVDDLTAKDDIEAWCRLSGNQLIKMEQGPGQELSFALKKK
jgi:TusA-related sulfurtransferase